MRLRAWGLLLGITLAAAYVGGAAAQPELRSVAGGTVRALVVGIDAYANVRPLKGSVNDAEDFRATLSRVGVTDLFVLVNQQATRAAFMRDMQRLLDASRSGDLAIITYSGHGATVPEYPQFKGLEPGGKTEEYVMVDFDHAGPASGEVVANKEIKAWLARFDRKGVDVLLISDSCFGGGMIRGPVDERVAQPSLRFLRDAEPAPGQDHYRPMAMSAEEMRLDVAHLSHVTFLAGADALTPVPEVFIPSSPTRRGALSYVLARAFEGKAAQGVAVMTRRALFAYARQQVQHYSDDQRIAHEPATPVDDSAILDRPVFRLVEPAEPGQDGEIGKCPVKVAVLGGAPIDPADLGQPAVPYGVVTDRALADLVWDPGQRQVIQSSGDLVKADVAPGELAGIIDRTSAIACIGGLTDARPQHIGLRRGARRYTPSDVPVVEADGIAGRKLLVFNVAANGLVQVVFPTPPDTRSDSQDVWTYTPSVTPPFGADYLVAVASSTELTDLKLWLTQHDNRPPASAGRLADQLKHAIEQDPTLRIGTVALYTSPR